MESFPIETIRKFSIIAHIDHGKSTLADRMLEITNTIPKNSGSKQVLDTLKVEKERGITVKAQTATLKYPMDISEQGDSPTIRAFLLNLIDTPGHVDFTWEVTRSQAACQGALLLIDSTQGIQAQTISVYHSAKERGLKIIPILNKVDLPAADVDRVSNQLETTFGIDPSEILHVSAKTGFGVDGVLQEIVRRIPPPPGSISAPLRALLFDSFFDHYRGVIMLLSIESGVLKKGDRIMSIHTSKKYEILDIGVMHPGETPTGSLRAGQVGYIVCNMKDPTEAHIGDTFHLVGKPVEPLIGFQPIKPMVFAGVFPFDTSEFPRLEESIKRLTLTDRSVTIQRESSAALGQGCRLGFLGTLHMDVFRQRLEDEYDANVLITAPTVPYKVIYRNGTQSMIRNPTDFPDHGDPKVLEIQEPYVKGTIIVPQEYVGGMMELCSEHRGGDFSDIRYLDSSTASARVLLECRLPLGEIVTDFFEKLKGRSSGFASFDYEEDGYERSSLHKMTFLLNNSPVDALAMIVHQSAHESVGRKWTQKLKEVIPRQVFEVPIQAVVKGKVVARETISAMRKDVTAGLYGGHFERKMKHLNKQKEGKARLKRIGKVDLPQEAFFSLLSSGNKK